MRTPLREFVAGNLFDDLLVPDVQVLLLPQAQGAVPDMEHLRRSGRSGNSCRAT